MTANSPSSRAPSWASPLMRALGAPLRDPADDDAGARADAGVVLGSPLTPSGGLTKLLDERVRAGVDAWERGAAPILCMTGGGPPGRVEADAMAARARELGVPDEVLRVERRSRTTEENARLVAEMLAPDGCRRVWVVTQPFHLRRARLLFERAGFDALGWRIEDSLEYSDPVALRWIAREYAAWAYGIGRRALSRERR